MTRRKTAHSSPGGALGKPVPPSKEVGPDARIGNGLDRCVSELFLDEHEISPIILLGLWFQTLELLSCAIANDDGAEQVAGNGLDRDFGFCNGRQKRWGSWLSTEPAT